jgi:hypothetical protein
VARFPGGRFSQKRAGLFPGHVEDMGSNHVAVQGYLQPVSVARGPSPAPWLFLLRKPREQGQ